MAIELRVGKKYRLGKKIGSGSFGDIYLGACPPSGRPPRGARGPSAATARSRAQQTRLGGGPAHVRRARPPRPHPHARHHPLGSHGSARSNRRPPAWRAPGGRAIGVAACERAPLRLFRPSRRAVALRAGGTRAPPPWSARGERGQQCSLACAGCPVGVPRRGRGAGAKESGLVCLTVAVCASLSPSLARAGVNVATGEEVAMKLESTKSKHPQLVYEAKLYKILQGAVGIPYIRWYGVEVCSFPPCPPVVHPRNSFSAGHVVDGAAGEKGERSEGLVLPLCRVREQERHPPCSPPPPSPPFLGP